MPAARPHYQQGPAACLPAPPEAAAPPAPQTICVPANFHLSFHLILHSVWVMLIGKSGSVLSRGCCHWYYALHSPYHQAYWRPASTLWQHYGRKSCSALLGRWSANGGEVSIKREPCDFVTQCHAVLMHCTDAFVRLQRKNISILTCDPQRSGAQCHRRDPLA